MDTSFWELFREFCAFFNDNVSKKEILLFGIALEFLVNKKELQFDYKVMIKGLFPQKINISKIEHTQAKPVKVTPDSLKRLKRNHFYNQAKEFNELLERVYSEESLNNYHNNIRTIKISKSKLLDKLMMQSKSYTGVYQPLSNTIKILKDDSIYHELFHMASTRNYKIIGFQQSDIGKSLNEGYTELMNQKYFINDKIPSYSTQVEIAKQLDRIVGKEKMENLYLNSDLKGLVNELRKYATFEDIEKFVSNSDYILTMEMHQWTSQKSRLKKNDIKKNEMALLKKATTETEEFLEKCLENKIIIEYKEKGEFEALEPEDVYLLLKIKNIDINSINNKLHKDILAYLKKEITGIPDIGIEYNSMFENIKNAVGNIEIYNSYLENGIQGVIDEMHKYLSKEEIELLFDNYEYVSDDSNLDNERDYFYKEKQFGKILLIYELRKEIANVNNFSDRILDLRIYYTILEYMWRMHDYKYQDSEKYFSQEKIIAVMDELAEEFNDVPKVKSIIKNMQNPSFK